MVHRLRVAAVTLFAVASMMPSGLEANDEPYLAIRTGLKCSACHVNRTGGGMRNDFGAVYGGTTLPMNASGFQFQNRALNDFVKIGMNLRVTGLATVSAATPRTALDVNRANLYVEADLIRDKLTLYVDETMGPGRASAREVFALAKDLPLAGYAKFGKFFLPYGMRVLDDDAFIRSQTGFSMLAPDQGVEVGIEPGSFAASISVTNGNGGGAENNSGKQVTGSAALVFPSLRFGASASRTTNAGANRDAVGGFGGLRVGPLSLLGEVDYLSEDVTGGDLAQLVAYGEGNLLVKQGVNAKIAYGFHDRNTEVAQDQRIRARFGLELFPMPLLQISTFYVVLDDIPQALNQQDRVTVELHMYF